MIKPEEYIDNKNILLISSKTCELIIKQNHINKKTESINEKEILPISSETPGLNLRQIPKVISKEKEKINKHPPLSISSNICVLNIIKKNVKKEYIFSPKTCEFYIIPKKSSKIKLFISSKISDCYISKENKNKLLTLDEVKQRNILDKFKNTSTSSQINEINILSNSLLSKDTNKKFFEKLDITSNQNELSIIQPIINASQNKFQISSNICEFKIIKQKNKSISLISSKESEICLIKNITPKNGDKTLNKKEMNQISYVIYKNNEINLEGINKEQYINKINAELKIESNINSYNILFKKTELIKINYEIKNVEQITIPKSIRISFRDLNISPKETEINISKQIKHNIKELSISSLINQIYIEKIEKNKKIYKCSNMQKCRIS